MLPSRFRYNRGQDMPIAIGTQLGSHEITALLGKGGMGEVYRARDLKLKREVAIKILPEEFSRDADRVSRFQREAEVLASLNHPNIANIYNLEEQNGSRYLVLELVDGETLADRVARGPLPFEEAVAIAKQICEALEAAHERGVIHRDLKPANIKLAPDGTVKVLDFGLAKALENSPVSSTLSNSPTMVSATMGGVILGTAAYMSPEQARGKTVDARTDVWAFGCVLYEMLTGRQTFAGETATEIIARVLEREPDWLCLPAATPYPIRLLLEGLLRKDPRQRLRNIGDARLFLQAAPQPEIQKPLQEGHRRERHSRILTAVFAVAFVAALIPSLFLLTRKVPEAPEMRFETPSPSFLFRGQPLSISPDGQRIAYSATIDGKKSIWVRPLGALTAQQVPGTEDGDSPFWSQDSRSIGFFASDAKVKKIELAGGAAESIGTAFTGGGTWNNDGVILVSMNGMGSVQPAIVRVSSLGEPPVRLTTPDGTRGEIGHFFPQFLPDGRHFLYLGAQTQQNVSETVLWVSALDSKERVPLLTLKQGAADAPPRFVDPGYLLYTRNGVLTAQAFDPKGLKVSGDPIPLADSVTVFAASGNVLIYQKGQAGTPAAFFQQLTWFDRRGNALDKVATPANYSQGLELSPDGHRAAVSELSGGTSQDIWIVDLDRKVPSRFTFDPNYNNGPVWSPDGSHILFGSSRGGGTVPNKIFQKLASGAGSDDLVYGFEPQDALYTEDWSRDGQIVFERADTTRLTFDIWYLPLSGSKKPIPYLSSPYNKIQAKLSPDGRYLAYATNESGMYQIVVHPFPDPTGGTWQVTAKGGTDPRWRRDDRELYYLDLTGKLVAVPVLPEKTFQLGDPVTLFQTQLSGGPVIPYPTRYDVTADGQRFLMTVPVNSTASTNQQPSTLVAVVNWTSSLRKK
jgi:eukaryotic-like serine/threonine-protein kinase